MDVSKSYVIDGWWGDSALSLHLSQAVPYRIRHLDDPYRIVMDFNGLQGDVDASGVDQSKRVTALRFGAVRSDLSRLVLNLDRPMIVKDVDLRSRDDQAFATLSMTLDTVDEADFAVAVNADRTDPEVAMAGPPKVADVQAKTRQTGEGGLTIVLDPGHGGIDPGAEVGTLREAHLMLRFARELREALVRDGHRVVLTRNEDVFVSLAQRVTIAHQTQADLFLSLHADALEGGGARGATVYTLAESASDEASAKLAQRHERGDILSGVDLTGQDDVVAGVLMDLARRETQPRSNALADMLVRGLEVSVDAINNRPRREAGFAVLKAPDVPSVLLELGFMSDARDLENLQNPEWRAQAVLGIVAGIRLWAAQDAAIAQHLRQ
ncbi:N-acetylmuramoyl-L-alanine amidase [Nereida sp. MMG025]|uniref:N-acetylmuramoyl-L-alanine amidase n=1 Tax=Nereida sp. MMG025 TaxID=2909981 RepID=UPI001F203D46|nr:N-acetylmuramoyl-L-alanine amidase [Nereida sp. MMG025]MCF6443650.1 N-acetylmuramoyl-L-alanine amidase [Nereida sp. MMG025]